MNWSRKIAQEQKYREYRPEHFCYDKELSDEKRHHTYYDTIIRDNVFLYMRLKGYSEKMMGALVSHSNFSEFKYGDNFPICILLSICHVLNIRMSDLMVDNTKILNPKILTMEPPEVVKNNAVRRECDPEWVESRKKEWFE